MERRGLNIRKGFLKFWLPIIRRLPLPMASRFVSGIGRVEYRVSHRLRLAFQQAVGNSPRRRHHVRFWQSEKFDGDRRPVWVGSAVYDERVGVSRTTGQITHVTAPDVDAERDYLFKDLENTGDLTEKYVVEGFHKQFAGRNGGGDPWRTDGNLVVGVIKAN